MSATRAVDRSRLCTFTFENNAQCRIPLSSGHPYLCTFHARREAEDRAADEAARDIAFPLSARYVSYCDLSSAIAHTITAVAYNRISTRDAATIAYLTQNLVQSLAGAEREFKEAFGAPAWRQTIADNFNTPRPSDSREQPANAQSIAPHDDHDDDDHDDDKAEDPEDALDQSSRSPEQAPAENKPEPNHSTPVAPNPAIFEPAYSPQLDPQPAVAALLNRLRIDLEAR
jgi:hypothetical protein